MEIFGRAVDSAGVPVAGAMVQRFYPGGQVYGDPLPADAAGIFNGRVPDNLHYWIVSAPGFLPLPVSLETVVVSNSAAAPVPVVLDAVPQAQPVVSMPAGVDEKTLWIVGGAVAVALLFWKKVI